MDELQRMTAQRDKLAHYIYEQNGGDVYWSHCRGEMEAGRCPYRYASEDTERVPGVCAPCIVKMVGGGISAPPSAFFSQMAEHHVLVSYFVICGTLEMGRVMAVEDGVITFKACGETISHRLEDIDVIVPLEVLRWTNDNQLTRATWYGSAEERQEPKELDEIISSCLLSIGIQPFMEGIEELEMAIRLVMERPELLELVGKRLYPVLAKELGKSASTVSYRLARIINAARRDSRETGSYLAFYSSLTGRNVSVKGFLTNFVRYMGQDMLCPPE